ncbi:MAG: hypothetical protein ACM3ZF_13845 [Mycobacterium leprae]
MPSSFTVIRDDPIELSLTREVFEVPFNAPGIDSSQRAVLLYFVQVRVAPNLLPLIRLRVEINDNSLLGLNITDLIARSIHDVVDADRNEIQAENNTLRLRWDGETGAIDVSGIVLLYQELREEPQE